MSLCVSLCVYLCVPVKPRHDGIYICRFTDTNGTVTEDEVDVAVISKCVGVTVWGVKGEVAPLVWR